jgi:hypothetical protein
MHQDLIRAHSRVGTSAKKLQSKTTTNACTRRASRLPDQRMISSDFELNLSMG